MLRWIFLLLATSSLASAQGTQGHAKAYDKTQGYVSDFANVIDVAGRIEIENYLGGLERGTGVQVAVVTVPSLDGEPIEDFTNNLFRKWGIGQKGTNEGLMVLFAIQDRKMRIEVGYGLEPILTDGIVGSVQRSLREELRAGRYGDAVLKCVRSLGTRIEQGKGIAGSDSLPSGGRVPREGPPQLEIPIWAILLGLFLIFFVLPRLFGGGRNGYSGRRYRGYGGGPFIGGGGWGGGGFGGSSGGGDSGGGFGGFGGGDSGGGGASSDW